MRMTTLLKKLLGIQHLLVTGFDIEDGALVIEVRPSWRTPRCSGCTKRRGRYDTLHPRRWRHLDFGGVRVYLRYGLRRVSCRVCGVVAEAVPWCDSTTARFTTRFEEAVGFLVQRCDKKSRRSDGAPGRRKSATISRRGSRTPFSGTNRLSEKRCERGHLEGSQRSPRWPATS